MQHISDIWSLANDEICMGFIRLFLLGIWINCMHVVVELIG